MSGRESKGRRRGRFTLEKAIGIAILLHLLLGALVTWWPGGLFTVQPAAAEPPPLQFRFVDTPDVEPPDKTPDTETLSDQDRLAADASERRNQETPFSEGNTPEDVLRVPQVPAEAVNAEPAEETPAVEPEATPDKPKETPETSEQPAETAETTPENAEERPAEIAEASPTPRPRVLPRRRGLRNSLAQLESFVDPQVLDNPSGGVDGPRSLAQFDTRGYDLGPYIREVLRTIERHWRESMPPLVQTGLGGATFIQLSIRRQRQVDGSEVAVLVAVRTWSSGQPAYDSAAQFSLELSNPLPPIPEIYPYETIEGRLGYIYNLDPNQVEFPQQ